LRLGHLNFLRQLAYIGVSLAPMLHSVNDSKASDSKVNLIHLSFDQLTEAFTFMNEPSYRVKQLWQWIWRNRVESIDEMTNLSKSLREKLNERYFLRWPVIVGMETSSDGTIKYLLQLEDLKSVETVWIPRLDQERVTVCISTQVGCRMGCTFCLTAQQKTERDLTAGEIAAQLYVLPCREEITNVVVMGMGEPFDNYDNLMGALKIANDPHALGIGASKITVSTSGLVPKIEKFIQESKCRLAISLNAPNDAIRTQIMPINKAYNMDTLLSALRKFSGRNYPRARKNNFYFTIEYILMEGLNDSADNARELVRRLKGIPCKVNLLMYNENPNTPFRRPTEEAVDAFKKVLVDAGMLSFLRKSRGRDISAACGQLASDNKRQELGA